MCKVAEWSGIIPDVTLTCASMNPHSCAYPPENTHTYIPHTLTQEKKKKKKDTKFTGCYMEEGSHFDTLYCCLYREPKAHSSHIGYTLGVMGLGTTCPRDLNHTWGLHGLLPISIFLRASQTSAQSWGGGGGWTVLWEECGEGNGQSVWVRTPCVYTKPLSQREKTEPTKEKSCKGPVYVGQNSEDRKNPKFEPSSWLILTMYLSRWEDGTYCT